MSPSTLGRRYERLLFFAAPLSLASVLTLFVVFATETQKERSTARCYQNAANFLEGKSEVVESAWNDFITSNKSARAQIDYVYKIRRLLIDTSLGADCYGSLVYEVEVRAKDGPKALLSGLRQNAKQLSATPIRYSGVEMPEKATVSLIGTSISIELPLFAGLLQVVLAPLLLLWLGSLYNTRYRESLLIEKARLVTDVFPHLINVYPAIRYPEPKRRSYVQAYLKHMFAFVYACVRVGLLVMFIGPAVAAYMASVVLLNSSDYFILLALLAGLVAVFALALLMCELFPWHYNKTFPGPPLVKRD